MEIKLTQYSHGAGCGCKISPAVLDQILDSNLSVPDNNRLLVGNHSKDDAAAYDLQNGMVLLTTTDFFMPIVDDPFEFGKIASANAISDIYAMGGSPVIAISILGWPVNLLPASVAKKVIEGSRSICKEAGIPLAGGHSIDSPEPIFGLSVNGLVDINHLKKNNTAQKDNLLFLTKPLGIGILTTAEKKGMLKPNHNGVAAKQMMALNKIGEALGRLPFVTAMTDVTGFGLLGHLAEICEGSGLSAIISFDKIKLITGDLMEYVHNNNVPGGTIRNLDSYGSKISKADEQVKKILADPQTSGGLLFAVQKDFIIEIQQLMREFGLEEFIEPIGYFNAPSVPLITVL